MKNKLKLKGYDLFKYAKTIIPGGSQLFGKRSELYAPGLWPSYYKKAKLIKLCDISANLSDLKKQTISKTKKRNSI